jgi:hypothetical protein
MSASERYASVGFDMTLQQAKAAYESGEIVWVGKNPHQLSIQFFSRTSDLFHVVDTSGKIRRFKDQMSLELALLTIKGL